MKTKQQAEAAGNKLLAKMKPKGGWKLLVWQNLGWHYRVIAAEGFINIVPASHEGKYFCMMSDSLPGAGSYDWRDTQRYSDPNQAVEETLRLAHKYVEAKVAFLKGVADALKEQRQQRKQPRYAGKMDRGRVGAVRV